MADRLVSHLIEASSSLPTDAKANSQDPKLWVRKFCSEVGCDVLKKQDANGKTLLHHLLSGKIFTIFALWIQKLQAVMIFMRPVFLTGF